MPYVFNGIDFNQVRADLEAYVESLPEASRWRDFVQTSTGSHVLDLLAGLGVYLRHSVGLARKESYVSTARLYNSLVAIANTLGYPVNRANAMILEISFTPSVTTSWSKYTPIGTFSGLPVSLLENHIFQAGVPIVFRVAVGQWFSKNIETTSENFQQLYVEGTIDNFEYNLYDSNHNLIPVRRYLEDIDPDSLVELTRPGGVVFLSGDGSFAKKLQAGNLTLEHIEPIRVEFSGMPNFSLQGTLNSVRLLRAYSEGDSTEKLTVVVPGYHAAKARAVTARDYKYVIMSYKGSIVDGAAYKTQDMCCTLDLVYVNQDSSATFSGDWDTYFSSRYPSLSGEEKVILAKYVKGRSLVGMTYRVFDPEMTIVEVSGSVYIDPSRGRDIDDIQQDIIDLFKKYRTGLGETFYIGEITADIGKLVGVSRVYITNPVDDLSTNLHEFVVIKPNFTYGYISD